MGSGQDWQGVLLTAASLVEEGWCQGAFHRFRDGDVVQSCAGGAISRAACAAWVPGFTTYSGRPVEHCARISLAQHLRSKSVSFVSIEAWNDHPDRTAAEVAEAMRQAAETT